MKMTYRENNKKFSDTYKNYIVFKYTGEMPYKLYFCLVEILFKLMLKDNNKREILDFLKKTNIISQTVAIK